MRRGERGSAATRIPYMAASRLIRTKAALAALIAVGVADWLIVNLVVGPAAFAARQRPVVFASEPRQAEPSSATRGSAAAASARPKPVAAAPEEPAVAAEPVASARASSSAAGQRVQEPSPGAPPGEAAGPVVLRFGVQSAALNAEATSALRAVARELQANPAFRARVAGHSDERGPEEFNRWLSQQRAEGVRAYLIRLGIDGARVEVVGHGSQDPVDRSGTREGLALNRRVEVTVQ